MATLTDMMNEVRANLAGYTFQQDRSTYLKTAVTTTTSSSASPLILSLGSTESVGKGIIEIDEETGVLSVTTETSAKSKMKSTCPECKNEIDLSRYQIGRAHV